MADRSIHGRAAVIGYDVQGAERSPRNSPRMKGMMFGGLFAHHVTRRHIPRWMCVSGGDNDLFTMAPLGL